jgi:hypothetical protein
MGMLEVAGLAVPVRRCQRPEVWPEPKKRASLKQYSQKPGSEHSFRIPKNRGQSTVFAKYFFETVL